MTDTFVSAVEVQRPWTRLTPIRKTGTLRYEHGHVAFEGSDGRRHVRVPLEQVTDIVRHRAGFGFWAHFAGERYFVVPRAKPRPGGYNPFYALLRPIATTRYLWACRGGRPLTRRWLGILDPTWESQPVKGLPRAVRTPIRATLTSVVVVMLPAYKVLLVLSSSA